MRIVMLSDLETAGGAAIAASRLAAALGRQGAEMIRLVRFPDGAAHGWRTETVRAAPRGAREALSHALRTWLTGAVTDAGVDHLLREAAPDVINVHNIHGAGWGMEVLETCLAHAPTVWTLHDMWSFTGRCAYSYDCRKFLTGCDATCPTADEYPALAPAHIAGAWEARRRALERHRPLVAVCPSRWLAASARAGLWRGHRVETIPYGLSLDTYVPTDRARARAALDLPADGPVVSFVANILSERRKGAAVLAEALGMVRSAPLTVLVLGKGPFEIARAGIEVRHLGFVDDERQRAIAYSAADVLAHPAPVDNLPNVVMESLACGTPVVGFPIGGVPDLVRPGATGWLAAEVGPAALAATIDAAIADVRNGRDLRLHCREVVAREYGESLQARRYLELFESLPRGRHQRGRRPARAERS